MNTLMLGFICRLFTCFLISLSCHASVESTLEVHDLGRLQNSVSDLLQMKDWQSAAKHLEALLLQAGKQLAYSRIHCDLALYQMNRV